MQEQKINTNIQNEKIKPSSDNTFEKGLVVPPISPLPPASERPQNGGDTNSNKE